MGHPKMENVLIFMGRREYILIIYYIITVCICISVLICSMNKWLDLLLYDNHKIYRHNFSVISSL